MYIFESELLNEKEKERLKIDDETTEDIYS